MSSSTFSLQRERDSRSELLKVNLCSQKKDDYHPTVNLNEDAPNQKSIKKTGGTKVIENKQLE